MKRLLRQVLLNVAGKLFGFNLMDQRTGKVVARVVVVRWKGGLRIIGLEGAAVYPYFAGQERETYWAQDLIFATHPPPDFAHDPHRSDLPSIGSGSGEHVSVVAET